MELFKATVMPNKKIFRKAADAFAHKMKSMNTLLIVGLIICFVIGPVLTYLSNIRHINDFILVPTLGIILVAYYFLAPVYIGNSLFKSQSKKNLNKEVTYSFTENELKVSTIDSSAIYNYSAIEELYETDDLICLYLNKSAAFIIPKSTIENPCCDVRMFLESKVGKKFVYVKNKSTGKAVAKIFAVFVASLVASILSMTLADIKLDEPQTFSYEDYSITADKHLYEWEEKTNSSYSLTSSDVTLTVDEYTQENLDYAIEKENASLEELAKSYCEGNQVKNVNKSNPYTYNIAFYDSYEGTDYYNLVCVQQIDDIYWVTQIYCEKYLEEDYADKFEGWISSIKHKTNAA